MPKDDLGVEYSDTVAEAIKDPKSSVLKEVLDYFLRRREAESEVERKKTEEEKLKIKKNTGPFGNIFGG